MPRSQSVPSPLLRFCAAAAPTLLFLYGVLWLVDGADGNHEPGLAWDLGHTMFLLAFGAFDGLLVGLRRLVRPNVAWQSTVATTATVAGLVGAAGFVW